MGEIITLKRIVSILNQKLVRPTTLKCSNFNNTATPNGSGGPVEITSKTSSHDDIHSLIPSSHLLLNGNSTSITISGVQFKALVDTGADQSFLNYEILKQFTFNFQR